MKSALDNLTLEKLQEALGVLPRADKYTLFLHPTTAPLFQRRLGFKPSPEPQTLRDIPQTLRGIPIEEMETMIYGIVVLQNDSAFQRWRKTRILEPNIWRVVDLRKATAARQSSE